MSGLDPLAAAFAAQAVANAQAAIDEAILSLGADITVIQSQVSVGDVIPATVLPPQGGTDLLSFLGQTVPAQIPPGVNPGESLLLQVTAFTNNAVIVRNLGTVDPENPVTTVDVQLPPQAPDAPQTAVLTTLLPPQSAPGAPASTAPVPPSENATSVAPPRAVFVEASVRAAPAAAIPADAVARATADAARLPIANSEVEARIAATRAGVAPLLQPAPASSAPSAPTQPRPAIPAEPAAEQPAVPAGKLPVAPPIVLSATPRAQAAQAPVPTQQASEPETPEAALLARLRVPITPVTLAAARLVETATSSMTSAYEKLDALLAQLPQTQLPPALRSMLGFVARMDLRDASALPEQIAAFVSDVVDGAESKVAQTVQAWLALAPDRSAEALQTPGSAPAAQTDAAQTTASAQASERAIALEYDAKTAIMAMLSDQSSDASPALASALRGALAATTAVQLGALFAQSNDPSAITLSLPAYFYDGGSPVQLRISRDAGDAKKKMDSDNFHIAFVLDTQSLGTVAIDVQTVGRAVSVDVKTQASLAADRFRTTFGDLRGRLERLRYRVANINAGIAAPLGASAPAKTVQQPEPAARTSLWDMRA